MTVIDQYRDPLFSILIPLLEGRNEAGAGNRIAHSGR
jgi:hypothetical protein